MGKLRKNAEFSEKKTLPFFKGIKITKFCESYKFQKYRRYDRPSFNTDFQIDGF